MSSSLVPGDERTPGTSRAAGAHLSSASSLGALYDSYALQQRDSRSRSSSCASSTTTSRASSRSRGAAAGEETERSATTTARQEGQQKGLHRRSSSRLKREHEHDESVAYLDTATMERSLSATSSANELLDDDEYAGLRRAAVPPAGAPLYPSTTDSPPSSPPRRRRPQQQRQRLHVSTPSVSPALARKNTLDALRRVSVRVVNLSGSHAAAAAAAGGDTDDENEARERPPTSARPPASPIRAAEDGPRSPLPLSEAEQAKARAMRAEELAKLEREQWRVLRGKSLGFFGPQSRLRRACADALAWSGTQPVILLAIVLETVVLAIQASKDVFTNPRPAEGYFHDWEDYVLFVIFALFTLEIAARIIATGLIRNTAPTTASPPPPPAYAPCDTYASFATHATRDTYDTYPPYSSTDALTDEKRRPPQRSQTTDSAWTTFERPSLGAQKINLRPPGASEGETGPQAPFALAIRQQQAAAVSAFLRHSWNRLDLVAVVAFWLSFALAMTGAEQRYNLYFFRAVSVVRTARLLAFTEGTATILHSLKVAAPQLANVAFFVVFAMVLFSIVGVQSFARSFTRACVYVGGDGGNVTMQDQRCGGFVNASSGERVGYIESQTGLPLADGPKGFICPVDSVCVEVGNPANGRFSFDNVLAAMQQVVIVTSANGWTDIMFAMQDADFAASCLFFIVCIVVLNFWLVNLFVAAITTSFEAIMDETGRSSFASTRLRDAAARAIVRPAAAETHLRRGASFLRKWYYRTQLVWVACVVVDVALLATRSYDMSQDWADLLVRAELAFTLVFDLEMVVRFVAYLPDWRGFVLQSSNVADLLLALATTIIQIPAIRNSLVYPWLTAFQIARFYRVIVAIPRMRKLLTRILGTLSGLINMIAFLLLITLIAALIAVQFLRGEVEQGDEMTFYQTFNAFLAMYQVFSSEDWSAVLESVISSERGTFQAILAAFFLSGWMLFSFFILFQMFIALINENFRIAEENKRLEQQQAYDRRHEPSNAIPGWYRRINPYTYLRRPDDDERKSGARFGQQLVQKAQRLFSARDPARDDGDVHKEAQERSLAILHERRASQLDFVVAHPSYDKSLWLFAQGNPVRRFCQRLVDPSSGDTRYGGRPAVRKERRAFKVLVFAAIIASVVVAAMATPLYRKAYFEQRASTRRSWFTYTEVSLGTVFLVEFVVKVIADGFLFTPNAYLLSTWNCVDFFVLLTLLVNVVTTLVDPLGVNRFTRALKAFRPLRLINLWAPLREAFFNVIIVGAGRIVDASILAILYIIPYAIWGLNIFAGLLFSCNDDAVASKNECVGEFATTVVGDGDAWTFTIPRVWTNPTVWSFDTFRQSLLILFEIISLEGWIDVMTSTLGIRGRDLQPEHDAAQWNALFFIAYNLAGGAFILALFVSVIIEGFTRQSGMSLLTLEQRQWVDLRKLIKRQRPAKRPKRRPTDALRSWCFDRATQKTGWYSKVMTSLYIIHVCVLMTQATTNAAFADTIRNYIFLALTLLYAADVAIRLAGLGSTFTANSWNVYDVVVVAGTFATTIALLAGSTMYAVVQLQKLFVVLIAFKLVQKSNSLNQLFKLATASLPTILSIFSLWFVLFLVFAILYMEVFGLTRWGPNGARMANYSTFGKALIMLSLASTGEGWNGFMHDYTVEWPLCVTSSNYLFSDCGSTAWALALFIVWNVLSMYLMANLILGAVVDNFSYIVQLYGRVKSIDRQQMRSYKRVWQHHERDGVLPRERVTAFFHQLSGVFEVKIYKDGWEGCDWVEIKARKRAYNVLYHEAMLLADENPRGVSFQKMLMLLAHHRLIDDNKALSLDELHERRVRLTKVMERVNIDRARSTLACIVLRRRFLQSRAPAIVVVDEIPRVLSPDAYDSDRGEHDERQSDNDDGDEEDMAKDASTAYKLFSTVLSLAIFVGFVYGVYVVVNVVKAAVDSTKEQLAGKGVRVTKEGASVKTNKRGMSYEESLDAAQRGIMKGWKASSFKVPDTLKYTGLAGSSHDKDAQANAAKKKK